MSSDTEKVTLGSGILYLNGVDVGHLKGDVEFNYTIEHVGFKPSNMLGEVKVFKVREECTLKAQTAELKIANLRLAMGSSVAVSASSSYPSYVGEGSSCSYVPPAAESLSFDSLTFGGDKTPNEMCLSFRHTRPNGKIFHIILYNAVSVSELVLPFHEDDVTMHDLTFKGLSSETRDEGDKIGVLIEQVNEA